MPTFEFNDGIANTLPTTGPTPLTGTGSIPFSDDGVNFTFSYNTTLGIDQIGHNPVVDGGKLFVDGVATAGPGITLTLEITGPGSANGFVDPIINFTSVARTWKVQLVGTTIGQNTTLASFNTPLVQTAPTGNYSAIKFTLSTSFPPGDAKLSINDINFSVLCFCAGTAIAAPDGPVAVEDLAPGDRILTADGGATTVKWLGEQPFDIRLAHPAKVNPICIKAGALADGVPARDLWVSPDHAIGIDGYLINAGALVNGETIYQIRDMPLDGFIYYHIETDGGHELLLAEGVAAESFIDYAGTDSFVNGDDRDGAVIAEMDLPRISAARLVPAAIRARVLERASRRARHVAA